MSAANLISKTAKKRKLYQGAFPDPDYASHPAYGRFFPKPSLIDRLQALRAFYPVFKKELKKIKATGWNRYAAVDYLAKHGKSDLVRDLAHDGAVGTQTPAESREACLQCLGPHLTQLESRYRQCMPGQRSFMDGILRIPEERQDIYTQIESMLDKMGVLAAAEAYLGSPVQVKTLNLMMGDATDTWTRPVYEGLDYPVSPVNYMHMDTIYHMLKCIWYLTPVTDEDGPFCYVPGTHRIRMSPVENAARLANYKLFSEDYSEKGRKLFWSLPAMFRRRANFGDDLMPGMACVNELLAAEHRFTSEDGDLILFDNAGFHRGSVFKSGSRTVLQIMLLPTQPASQSSSTPLPAKVHPLQLPPTKNSSTA